MFKHIFIIYHDKLHYYDMILSKNDQEQQKR